MGALGLWFFWAKGMQFWLGEVVWGCFWERDLANGGVGALGFGDVGSEVVLGMLRW